MIIFLVYSSFNIYYFTQEINSNPNSENIFLIVLNSLILFLSFTSVLLLVIFYLYGYRCHLEKEGFLNKLVEKNPFRTSMGGPGMGGPGMGGPGMGGPGMGGPGMGGPSGVRNDMMRTNIPNINYSAQNRRKMKSKRPIGNGGEVTKEVSEEYNPSSDDERIGNYEIFT